MRYFKLGCKWGTGAPDFYDFLKNNEIVISHKSNFIFEKNDFALITQGFTVKAIVQVLGSPIEVTNNREFENDFLQYEIDYDNNVIFSKAKWFELESNDVFEYKLQQGIREVQDKDILIHVNSLIQKYKNLLYMYEILNVLKGKKQIILQGAPGTGKTYSTAEIALRIIEKNDINFSDRNEVMNAYNEAIKDGQIVFTTFHQSLDYEEFIEGIKPIIIDKEITYDVVPGIFKKICKKAIQKDSLKELQYAIEKFKEICVNSVEEIVLHTKEKGEFTVDYRGGITFRVRSKNSKAEVGKDFPASIENIEKLYKGEKDGIYNKSYVWGILEYLKKEYNLPKYKGEDNSKKNYVLIIDEINRGNISKIFGELITLLEADKRLDGNNKMTCTLPYSNTEFGVPGNLFIIGTMNTTDRSLGHIDYAIRRRFAFVTLKSNSDAINSFYNTNEELKEMATNLYKSIVQIIGNNISPEFTKEDIMIGHSYFMATNKEELEQKLEFEIKPLLREYVKDGILTLSIEDIKNNIDTVTLN